MTNLSHEYLRFLATLKGAPLEQLHYQHESFWLQRAGEANREFQQAQFAAYHLGVIPSRLDASLLNNWFLDPQVNLQRVGLYADVIVFDDIVAHILAKRQHVLPAYEATLSEQVQRAIDTLLSLHAWVEWGIVKILPGERVLRKMWPEQTLHLLDAVSTEEASGSLPDLFKSMLTAEQREALSLSAGHALNYKINKALLLKEQFDLVPSADDTFYDILGEKLQWNHQALADTSNLYVLRKIRAKYLCSAPEVVFELRKQDKLATVRSFLREQINDFFKDDIRARSDQASIDEFSRALADQFKQAEAELDGLKRQLGSEAIVNLVLGGTSMLLGLGLDFGASYAAWIPKIVGAVPAANAGAKILDAIRDYMRKRSDLKTKPTFILGSQLEKST